MRAVIPLIAFFGIISSVHTYISVQRNRLVDSSGAELIFHGLNVVSKVPPYHTVFNEADMQLFQSLGINGLRLGVMWPGVEPRRGQYNETYLKLMRDTVQLAAKYNIYTLVEFHQDLFSEKYCGDGVPMWAVPNKISKSFPKPIEKQAYVYNNQTGLPRGQDCGKHSWGEYYISRAVSDSFGALYSNKEGLLDLFRNYWQKVASTFKGVKNVIAYELINEPWPGSPFYNPLVMVPGLSEALHLQSFYDMLGDAIRQVDPDHSICFEPVTWLNFFPSGFGHPPGGHRYSNTSIFCYHYYDPPTYNLGKFMKARMRDIRRLKTGGILSEFYVMGQEGEDNIEMMNQCDKNLQSWFGWIYEISEKFQQSQKQQNVKEILQDEGSFGKLVAGVTRTYAWRVGGKTISQYFAPADRRFELRYILCLKCGPTMIFVSVEHVYKQGYTLNCYPQGLVCQKSGDYYISVTGDRLQEGISVLVVITAL